MENKDPEKHFGQMIRIKRNERKITQEQLAELVGISTTYLRGVEHGEHLLTWKIWLRLCLVLHLNIEEIIDIIQIDNDI